MKVLQVLPTISYGDGVGNDCIAIKKALKNLGYETEIYAENIDKKLPAGTAYRVDRIPSLHKSDIILYHLSTGDQLNMKFLDMPGKKIVRYHNITPPQYFKGYNEFSYNLCNEGYKEAEQIAISVKYLLAVSDYNRQQMFKMGFRGDSEIAPILIPFNDYKQSPDYKIIDRYKGKKGTNIVFVGRIAPNKKQERLLMSFYYYKKYYDKDARLFLVGSSGGMEKYEKQLKDYANEIGLTDVYFTGHIKFKEILSYYEIADTFVCMSDHEGFCIPLVEAMYFNKPIIALNTSAIGETLNGAGILLPDFNPIEVAGIIDRVNADQELRSQVLENQQVRLLDFSEDKVLNKIVEYIKKVENR